MTEQELEKIEARANAATPGKWTAGEVGVITTDAKISERYDQVASILPICDKSGHCYQDGTTAFIAHARTDVPALVAEVRRLQGIIKTNAKHLVWRGVPSEFLFLPIIFEDKDEEHVLVCMCVAPSRSITHDAKDLYSIRFQVSLDEDEDFEPFDTEFRKGLKNALDCAELIARQLGFVRDFDTIERPEAAK